MVRVAKKSTRSDVEVVNWWVGVEDGGGGASESRMEHGKWSMENGAWSKEMEGVFDRVRVRRKRRRQDRRQESGRLRD